MLNHRDLEIFQGFVSAEGQVQASQEAPGETVLQAGRYLLGAPYTGKTLDASGPEGLIINLRTFDCFTLIENCCALAVMRRTGNDRFADYGAVIQSLRYRDGVIDGYPSRLHYFTDWLRNSEARGLIRDMTQALGGISYRKELCFMTTHPELYPPLQAPAVCRQMMAVERRLSETSRHFLPKGEISRREEGIAAGDIMAVTTDQEGLDVCHVGIAVWIEGRLHLLHASPQAGQVVISRETLVDYLHQSPHRTGIMVVRLVLMPRYSGS